jgi:hypothetical protein
MNGLQCHRLLWMVFNDPAKVPGPNESTQHIFDQGHMVGELAQKLFPGGTPIPTQDFKGNINKTKELLMQRKPLFEPAFMVDNLYSRLDILNPAHGNQWDIVEVKSSTSVKEENIQDVAFQKLCAQKTGVQINKCFLAFINNQYIRKGELDPTQLFTVQDISAEVEAASEGIEERIRAMFEVVRSNTCPVVPVGTCCSTPYDCVVRSCWDELPDNNIFCLYRGGKKCFELFHSGILHLKDIPFDYKLSASQKTQVWCDINSAAHVEVEAIQEFLKTLKRPLYFMDFETINPALPLFNGVRPYQRVPFQYSVHIIEKSGQIRHEAFLAEGTQDPRPQFLERLKESIGPKGSIVTYNQSFEEGVLKELAEAFPEYGKWVEGARSRLVDLLKPFQEFSYYHPDQHGSASIKSVLPALTGQGYEGMAIADGEAASRAFMYATYGEASEEERRQVRADLERYCGLDTEAMVMIVERLGGVARGG